MARSSGRLATILGHLATYYGHLARKHGRLALSYGHLAISLGHLAISSGRLAASCRHLSISHRFVLEEGGSGVVTWRKIKGICNEETLKLVVLRLTGLHGCMHSLPSAIHCRPYSLPSALADGRKKKTPIGFSRIKGLLNNSAKAFIFISWSRQLLANGMKQKQTAMNQRQTAMN